MAVAVVLSRAEVSLELLVVLAAAAKVVEELYRLTSMQLTELLTLVAVVVVLVV